MGVLCASLGDSSLKKCGKTNLLCDAFVRTILAASHLPRTIWHRNSNNNRRYKAAFYSCLTIKNYWAFNQAYNLAPNKHTPHIDVYNTYCFNGRPPSMQSADSSILSRAFNLYYCCAHLLLSVSSEYNAHWQPPHTWASECAMKLQFTKDRWCCVCSSEIATWRYNDSTEATWAHQA